MIIHEMRFETPKIPSVHTIYRVPDLEYGKGYDKWARQINCFFHGVRRKSKIHYARTNLRQFQTKTEEEWRDFLDIFKKYTKDPVYTDPIQLASLDEFFEIVGFSYKEKQWLDLAEHSMKFKYPPGIYVNP